MNWKQTYMRIIRNSIGSSISISSIGSSISSGSGSGSRSDRVHDVMVW
jgi:hypothetical protein